MKISLQNGEMANRECGRVSWRESVVNACEEPGQRRIFRATLLLDF